MKQISKANIGPLDIVDVKAGIRAGRLFVQIMNNHLQLGDFQTGEVVSLSDIEVKAVMHARWKEQLGEGYTTCTNCGFIPHSIDDKFCPNCGARMDAEEDET